MQEKTYAVILAGGQGKRFWPMSTRQQPKQLLQLLGEQSFLEMAVDRVKDVMPLENIMVLTNQSVVEASREAAPSLPPANIIGEPVGRDTAPAVALSCLLVEHADPDGVFCILTADQVMKDIPLFQKTLTEAAMLAGAEEVIVTIGIDPAEPSTSFGYIETEGDYRKSNGIEFLKARRFVEKPDVDTARKYVESGNYFWNAGMFIWSVKTLRKGLERHAPELAEMMDRLAPHVGADDFMERVHAEYMQVEKISVDYALLEKSDNIVVAKGTFGWDDLGSWPALANHFAGDADGNVVIGDMQAIDASGNIVVSPDRLTALVGVADCVVVQTDKVTLVCPKDRAQDVKKMVQKLEELGTCDEVL